MNVTVQIHAPTVVSKVSLSYNMSSSVSCGYEHIWIILIWSKSPATVTSKLARPDTQRNHLPLRLVSTLRWSMYVTPKTAKVPTWSTGYRGPAGICIL